MMNARCLKLAVEHNFDADFEYLKLVAMEDWHTKMAKAKLRTSQKPCRQDSEILAQA